MPWESSYSVVVLVPEVKLAFWPLLKKKSQAKWMQWCWRCFKEQGLHFISVSSNRLMRSWEKKIKKIKWWRISLLHSQVHRQPSSFQIYQGCKSLPFGFGACRETRQGNVNNVLATNRCWWHTARKIKFQKWNDLVGRNHQQATKIAENNVIVSSLLFF